MQALQVSASLESLARIARDIPAPEISDKFAARRIELAKAALETLATLGYARTSLRDIAQNTNYSHGVLHYYFSDKVDLITCCVSYYKSICVTRYDKAVFSAETQQQMLDSFVERIGASLRDEAPLHRLWYDLRTQAMYEDAFFEDVAAIDKSLEDMVWRICTKYCELGKRTPGMSKSTLYALFDGLFQQAMFRHLNGDADAVSDMQGEIRALLPNLMR